MTQLDPSFLTTPISHRAYHDITNGRPENSVAAIRAAMDAGYGIEIDIQYSADGVAMVFHDYVLDRLTDKTGTIAMTTADDLRKIPLKGGAEGIPTLSDVLTIIGGKVPLLIEIKDQDGALGPNIGALERAIAADIDGYTGPIAVMSFNPHTVAVMADLSPQVPRGITTDIFSRENWGHVADARRRELREISDLDRVGASFISHRAADLASPRVTEIRQSGMPVFCWTIKSEADEKTARTYADNVTFEGYAAQHP